MSYALEQDPGELRFLKNGVIKSVKVARDDSEYGFDAIELEVQTASPITDQDGNTGRWVKLQVWQDVEGNGPGYLALMGIAP